MKSESEITGHLDRLIADASHDINAATAELPHHLYSDHSGGQSMSLDKAVARAEQKWNDLRSLKKFILE